MRAVLYALAAFAAMTLAPFRADAAPDVVTDNPAAYAAAMADAMVLTGMRPLREAFRELLAPNGEALPANIETTLLTYERAVGQSTAHVSRVIEDVVLADTVRSIYLYHYFGGNNWVFTRLDFSAIGEGRWALTGLTFADRWSNIVLATTPGFRPAAPGRR
jgi:hypothetical protein